MHRKANKVTNGTVKMKSGHLNAFRDASLIQASVLQHGWSILHHSGGFSIDLYTGRSTTGASHTDLNADLSLDHTHC